MSNDSQKLIAEMFLQIQNIATEIAQIRSQLAGSPSHVEGWAAPQKAAKALESEGIRNAKHLQQVRLDGAFSEDRGEIRNVSKGGTMPRWEYHVPKCRAALRRHFRRLRSVS
jgi:hypothetical protein